MLLSAIALAAALPAAPPPAPAPIVAAPRGAPAAPVQPAATDADPALWVVKDADTTIYLFGTIHVLKPGLGWFDEAVADAFARSAELRLEMVLPPVAEAQATASRFGLTAKGATLPQRLPPAARAKYRATLAALGLPADSFDRFQPWYAANNLTIIPILKAGYALDSGAEQVLTRAARAAGKPITGFETMDQQLGYFAGLSPRAQLAYLTSVLDELPTVGTTIAAMVDDWSRGDPAALATLINDDLDSNPELSRVLLAQRNARWADWIKGRLAQPGTVFVAVGAGHLAGRDSVQAQLTARGVASSRIAY